MAVVFSYQNEKIGLKLMVWLWGAKSVVQEGDGVVEARSMTGLVWRGVSGEKGGEVLQLEGCCAYGVLETSLEKWKESNGEETHG